MTVSGAELQPEAPASPPSVLGKTMQVLLAFSVEEAHLSFTDLRTRTGLSKATLHRLFGDLVVARLLEKTPDGYRLSRLVSSSGCVPRWNVPARGRDPVPRGPVRAHPRDRPPRRPRGVRGRIRRQDGRPPPSGRPAASGWTDADERHSRRQGTARLVPGRCARLCLGTASAALLTMYGREADGAAPSVGRRRRARRRRSRPRHRRRQRHRSRGSVPARPARQRRPCSGRRHRRHPGASRQPHLTPSGAPSGWARWLAAQRFR